ncbi:MAG: HAD family hydrolase [Janthinobacterium lividum]
MNTPRLVFFSDVDNTLLDNDQIQNDLRAQLRLRLGDAACDRYWQIFEKTRDALGYADYLGSLQQLREQGENDLALLQLSTFMLDYPFPQRLYAKVPEVLQHLRQWGDTVILSDGDVVFQPHKIQGAGLWRAVEGRVLIYIHKEQMLERVERAYPALHYVMIDDKLRVLTAMKQQWGARLTTIFVRQGHYGLDDQANASYPAADVSVERIGDLLDYQPPSQK